VLKQQEFDFNKRLPPPRGPVLVRLTDLEIQQCKQFGTRIRQESLRLGLRDKHGFDGNPELALLHHISGACGELAASKVYRFKWEQRINIFHAPDLGCATQVRTLRRRHYDLIVRPADSDDHFFILVTGQYPHPVFWVIGHIKGRNAKRPEWFVTVNNRPRAYFVPQRHLAAPPPQQQTNL